MAERESAQAEHDRKEAEKEAERVERRTRLGHETPSESNPSGRTRSEDPAADVEPGPTGAASTPEDKPKARRHRKAESEE